MRPLLESLQTHLDSGATTLCTCWLVVRTDGVIFGFTDHDREIEFAGVTFAPGSGADGAQIVSTNDLSSDSSAIIGALNADYLSAEDLAAGKYDDAAIQIWRVNWQNPEERFIVNVANFGETSRSGDSFTVELRGISHHLSKTVGRVFQRQCDAVLGDQRCGINLDIFWYKGAGAVSEIVDEQTFVVSGLSAYPTDWFSHGVLSWTGGANTGVDAHVKSSGAANTGNNAADSTGITLWLPVGAPIAINDAFTITAGCSRSAEACVSKFNNLDNFRGFHQMPGNDFAVSYPVRADRNDGGKR